MEKIQNFLDIEKFIYEEQRILEDNVGPLRFVEIKRSQGEDYFYYDCLLADIVILNRHQVSKWKLHQLMNVEFPFSIFHNVNDKPKFQKKEWYIAVENAEHICKFLKKQRDNSLLDSNFISGLELCIENIKQYFGLKKLQSNSELTINRTVINTESKHIEEQEIMKKIHNFANIEKLVYEESGDFQESLRFSRFVQLDKYQGDDYFYYDCLRLVIVVMNQHKVRKWKSHQLMEQDFPFCTGSAFYENNIHKGYKNLWNRSVENAKNICYFLKKQSDRNISNTELHQDLKHCIENIEAMIKKIKKIFQDNNIKEPQEPTISELLLQNKKSSSNEKKQDNIVNILEDSTKNNDILPEEKSLLDNNFTIVDNFIQSLHSPSLFQELNFGEKHTNKVYLLLEKIFHNFAILSKYKMEHIYEQVTNMDQYLVNHMKNIYLAQKFPMVNIEEETISILTKFNTYLTQEIDKYLEQCIDNQLSLIDSIHNKFTKVNQI